MAKKPEKKSIYALLLEARNNLTKNDDCMRELLSDLTGKDEKKWTRYQCQKSFENILDHYTKKSEKEMILDISGLSGKYDQETATDRRESYLFKHDLISFDKQRKRENSILERVAKEIQKDIDSGEIKSIIEKLIPNNKIVQVDLENDDISSEEMTSDPAFSITNNIINTTSNNDDNNKEEDKKINKKNIGAVIMVAIVLLIIFSQVVKNFKSSSNKTDVYLNMNESEGANINIYNKNKETTINKGEDKDLEDSSWPHYTMDQINANILLDRIVFNSVDDERNFVSARKANSDMDWETDTIIIENNKQYDDEEYEIRVKIKNDNPNPNTVAKGTTIFFDEIPQGSAKSIPICAHIQSENAKPKTYTNDIKFSSHLNFKLTYVEDSAVLINQNSEKNDGIKLGDIFRKDGNLIGYKFLDGRIPGGDEYASIITFRVKAIFDVKNVSYTTTTKVRLADSEDKSWKDSVDAKLGDKVEFRIEYTNTSDARQNNVAIDDILPSNLHYIKGSTKGYNSLHPKGAIIKTDELVASGIYVGNYDPGANAIIHFQAEVVNDDFTCGRFILYNWGRASIGEKVMQDSATVVVQLPYCPDLESDNTTTE